MNDFPSFVQLVQTMRLAQKKYFKERTTTSLQRAKNLEHQVDVQVERLMKVTDAAEQLSLPTAGDRS